MQYPTDSNENFVPRWRRISRSTVLAVLGGLWLALLAYALATGTWSADPSELDTFTTWLPLLAAIPALLRLIAVAPIENERLVYRAFRNLSITVIILGVVGLVSSITVDNYTVLSAPEDIWTFLAGRVLCLVGLMTLPVLAESLVQVYRQRATGNARVLPNVFIAGMCLNAVLAQLTPIVVTEEYLYVQEFFLIAASLIALVGLVLATRSGWIINLQREQKWKLVGLATVAVAGAGMMLVAVDHNGGTRDAILTFSPGLLVLTATLAVSALFTGTVIFVSSILALPTAGAIDRRNAELSSLANLASLLTQSLDTDHLIDTAIEIAKQATGASTAWIELREGGSIQIRLGKEPRISLRVARQLMTQPIAKDLVIAQAVSQRRRAEVIDRIKGTVLYKSEAVSELRSMAAAPLQHGDQLLGTLYVAKDAKNGFDRRSTVLVSALADQIALAIEQSRLIRTSIERQRFEQEMLIARDLQERLLPKQMPQSPFFELYAESLPASIVGGDYFDVVAFSDNTIGLLVADVSGKGASAALYMGMIKGIVQALSGQCSSPKELMARANVALHGSIDQRWFATMSCAQIVDERRLLRIARAGHCPTLVVRSGVATYHKPPGLGLAIARPALFDQHLKVEEMTFCPGDYAIFFSDGLPEARSPDGDEWGYERLMQSVAEAAVLNPDPKEMRDVMFSRIEAFTHGEPLDDDSTLVILRWH